MKYIFSFFLVIIVAFSSCSKLSNCEAVVATCLDEPPTNEACNAMFRRWFYVSETDKCELIPYSGCSPWGFETEAECNQCKCKK